MLASFSIIPIGVGEELREYVSEILKLIDELAKGKKMEKILRSE